MAVLSTIPAYIVVENTALREYADPDTNIHPEPGTLTRYIEVASNMEFEIHVSVPATFTFLSDVLILKVFFDGKFVTETAHQAPDMMSRIAHKDLRFPLELATLNLNDPGDAHLWQDKEIVLQVSHGSVVPTESEFDVLFGQLRRKAVSIPDPNSVLASTWKYRPPRLLRTILALPRTSFSSLPLLDPAARQHCPPWPEHPQDAAWKEKLARNGDPELYCYCKRITGGPVIACDNEECAVGHFHMFCVGLKEQPRRLWVCDECRGLPRERLRVKGIR